MVFVYILVGCVVVYLLFYKFVFLRDWSNNIPEGNNIVSPASGKIISIQTVTKDSDLKIRKGFFGQIETQLEMNEPYYLINIFMSPFDEHYTKMPCGGKVVDITKKSGKFRAVNTLDAGIENEKQEFLLETKIGMLKVIQIAGLLARRCRSYVQHGDSLQKGEKLGVILLGSQVALLFPKKEHQLVVKQGDRVSAGETIICDL